MIFWVFVQEEKKWVLRGGQYGVLSFESDPQIRFHGLSVAYPGILFGGGVQQIRLRTEERENGDLGAVAP